MALTKVTYAMIEGASVNVLDYGAIGDGSTDNTTAFSSAIAASTGKILYVPTGEYVVTGIEIDVADCTMQLEPNAQLTLKSASNAPVVLISGNNSAIIGGKIDGNKSNQSSSGQGVKLTGSNTKCENVTIFDCYTYGVYALNANSVTIIGNNVSNTDNIAIFVEATSANIDGPDILFNKVDRSALAITLSEGGIKVHGDSSTYSVKRAKIIGNEVKMPAGATTPAAICIEVFGLSPRSVVSDNSTEGGYMGISADKANSTQISGNTVYAPNNNGIEVAYTANTIVNGNTIYGNSVTDYGITLSNTTPDMNVISNNTIIGITNRGIKIQSAFGTVISGNSLDLTGSVNAIEISSSNHTSCVGNTIRGGASAYYLDSSNHLSITGGSVYNTSTSMVRFAGTWTASNITIANIAAQTVSALWTQSGSVTISDMICFRGITNTSDVNTSGYDIDDLATGIYRYTHGTSTPEAAITANPGSTYASTNGSVYRKGSGTGNTGWVAM